MEWNMEYGMRVAEWNEMEYGIWNMECANGRVAECQ